MRFSAPGHPGVTGRFLVDWMDGMDEMDWMDPAGQMSSHFRSLAVSSFHCGLKRRSRKRA